jgi:L-ascorbate metabolism protein UlaG (beta-lactamase superfamily)
MDIVYYGHSCFRLNERGLASVVTDPFDSESVGYGKMKLRADIVSISHDAAGHNYLSAIRGKPYVVNGPGEYEIGGVFVTGVQTNGKNKHKEDQVRNTLYVFDYNGITVAHLGDLKRVPGQAEIEALGPVDVLLVPVGGGGGLNAAKAAEVVSLIEPGIVIPMHYQTPASKLKLAPASKFLKEMGMSDVEAEGSLKVSRTTVPEETKVVVLSYDHS